MPAERPDRTTDSDHQSFAFGESIAPPLLPFLNRGKKPTIYFVSASALLIIFPIYMFIMFTFLLTPFAIVTIASIVLLVYAARHYFSLVTEARVDDDGLSLRGYRRFRRVSWADLEAVSVSRQMDPDFISFRLEPRQGSRLAVRRFRIWNQNAATNVNDPVQAFINAIRLHLVKRDEPEET